MRNNKKYFYLPIDNLILKQKIINSLIQIIKKKEFMSFFHPLGFLLKKNSISFCLFLFTAYD